MPTVDPSLLLKNLQSYAGQLPEATRATFLADLIQVQAALSHAAPTLPSDTPPISNLADLVHSSDDAIISKTLEGIVTTWNQAAEALYGYSAEEMVGQPVALLFAPDHQEDFQWVLDEIRAGRRIQHYHTPRRRKDGQLINISLTVSPIHNAEGVIVGASSISRDVTSMEQATDLLRSEKELAQKYLDVAGVVLLVLNPEGQIVLINQVGCQILGYDLEEELIGKDWFDEFVPPSMREPVKQDFLQRSTNAETLLGEHETLLLTRSGEERLMRWRTSFLRTPQGEMQALIASGEDITERKRAEKELYQSRQMLLLVLDSIPQQVFWVDRNDIYLGCNRAFAQVAGVNGPKDLIGKHDRDLWWHGKAISWDEEDRTLMNTDTSHLDYIVPFTDIDGSPRWVCKSKMPLHDRDGNVFGLLGTIEDITDQKYTEEEMLSTSVQLKQWVTSLEKRNHESDLMRQMGDFLQACNTNDEAYSVVAQFAPQLFQHTSGGLFVMNNSRRALEAMATWGNLQSETLFPPEDCWALRRGQLHEFNATDQGLVCRHVDATFRGAYIGIPMMAYGELMGLLHIEFPQEGMLDEPMRLLARITADHLALSFSNLRLRETLRAQSIRDTLTGLFNRRYMEESLEREFHRAVRKQYEVGIIMFDIDHFKYFNDTFGHNAGDAILRELGIIFQHYVRKEDIACRYGGEEFILIMPDITEEVAMQRAEKICSVVRAMTVEYQRQPLGVITLSGGLAMFADEELSVDRILKRVDVALYAAKNNGRNRIEIASSSQKGTPSS